MIIQAHDLRHAAEEFLQAAGSEAAEAHIVADHMVEANLKGHDSHGVGLLASYAAEIKGGRLNPNTPARLTNDAGAILQFAGDRGYGQRVGREAMSAAIERARETGVALMTINQTHHLGRIGTYGEQAAAAGLISIHFVNVVSMHPLVAPYNGSEARFGTNPVCIAIPGSKSAEPFVMDFATSMVALGKTRVAYLAGTKFDDDVMVDAHGVPTNDPTVMWEGDPRGALLPFAKHKGGGMIVAAELLAGLLSGGGTIQPEHPRDETIINNMTTIVIDPSKLGDTDWFHGEFDALIAYMKSSHQADPEGHPILTAGEIERQRKAQRLAEGVEISDHEWQAVADAGVSFGVDRAVFGL